MNFAPQQATIEAAWESRHGLDATAGGALREAVEAVLEALDQGRLRVAEKTDSAWRVRTWVKKAILLYFRLTEARLMPGGPDGAPWFDKVPLKCAGWDEARFCAAGFRAVPGALVRHGAYVAPGAVLMPSFINIGAHVGARTMVDSWATIGSCAQIGADCHISGGAGIGGVLEPVQAAPVIIEDNCFIGARSEVAEGVIVEQGAVLSMGVYLGASTKIVDRETGEILRGRVPAYSVVVPGTIAGEPRTDGGVTADLYAAVIVKRVDARTRAKVSPNDLLRD